MCVCVCVPGLLYVLMVVPERETLLHVAINCGSEDIIKLIVKEGMTDIEARTIPEEVIITIICGLVVDERHLFLKKFMKLQFRKILLVEACPPWILFSPVFQLNLLQWTPVFKCAYYGNASMVRH